MGLRLVIKLVELLIESIGYVTVAHAFHGLVEVLSLSAQARSATVLALIVQVLDHPLALAPHRHIVVRPVGIYQVRSL